MFASTTLTPPTQNCSSMARQLSPRQRLDISLSVMAGACNVSEMAAGQGVSRNFCYQQAARGRMALEEAFAPCASDQRVLFHLPVTHAWIKQFVLAQSLIGHTAGRGVLELLDCL